VELCDDDFMRATNVHGQSERKYPEKDSLHFKVRPSSSRPSSQIDTSVPQFQGSKETIKQSAAAAKSISQKHGGTGFSLASSEREAADLWADRKNALYSSLALRPGAKGWSTDVWCVRYLRW
jgi:D-lactate dehydrogenase (cytochrome)